MLTKNFYAYMRCEFQNTASTFTATNGTTHKDIGFTTSDPPFIAMKTWANTASSYGLSFGTGTTPATASDYCLESILGTTQISASVPSTVSYSRVDTYEEYSVTFGVTNKTGDAITISEAGLTIYDTNNPYPYVLVDRTVLDTPVTIPAGQSKQITYTIRFNYGDTV